MQNKARTRLPPRRWQVIVSYTTPRETKTLSLEELEELHALIEQGPDFNEIEEIRISYAPAQPDVGLQSWLDEGGAPPPPPPKR